MRAGVSNIALLDLNTAGLAATREILLQESKNPSIKVAVFTLDVSQEDQVVSVFSRIKAEVGRIDYAVNNAGIGSQKATADLTVEEFDRTIAVNLRSVFLCTREELKIMQTQELDSDVYDGIAPVRAQRGAIVNTGSVLGLVPVPAMSAYSASKGGVIAQTRSDALDYASYRIRINTVLPGTTKTPAWDREPEDFKRGFIQTKVPMNRVGEVEELADVTVFMCSNKASYIQGVALPVDGGSMTK